MASTSIPQRSTRLQLSPVTGPFFRAQPGERRVRLPGILGRAIRSGDVVEMDISHPGYGSLHRGDTCYTSGSDGRCWAVQKATAPAADLHGEALILRGDDAYRYVMDQLLEGV